MKALATVKDTLHDAFENLTEGWHHLLTKAKGSVVRFTPTNDEPKPVKQQWSHSFGYGLLAADVFEDNTSVMVRVEVPGLAKEDLHVSVEKDMLIVTGQKETRREEHKGSFHLMECAYGSFRRAIPLPCPVESGSAEAKCKDGVLQVTLTKDERHHRKLIPIR